MKKTIILVGMIAWLCVAVLFTVILVFGLSGGPLPGFIGGLGGGGWDVQIGPSSATLIRSETFGLDGLGKLQLEAQSQSIIVTLTDDNDMTVTQYDRAGAPAFADDRADGTLRITLPSARSIGILAINHNPRLEIALPRRYENAVAFSASSGLIRVNGTAQWGDVSLNVTSGSIRTEDLTAAGSLALGASSGSIRAGRLTAGDFSIEAQSGSVRIDELDGKGQLRVTSGSIRADNVLLRGDITSEVTSGSQTFGLSANENFNLELRVTSGMIRANDYSLSFRDNRGREAYATIGTGEDGTFTATATSGAIRIR